MNRQNKYPDTPTFHFQNVNPKNKLTGDCVVRAITLALDQTYIETYRELFEYSLKTGYMLNDPKNYGKYLESKGWKKLSQPRKMNGRKYTGEEFCQVLTSWLPFANDLFINNAEWDDGIVISNNIVAHIGGNHVVAIIDGKVCDTWNCTGGCIGNYWIK